jgi:hypothetical protein
MSAAMDAEMLDTDWWNGTRNRVRDRYQQVYNAILETHGADRVVQVLEDAGLSARGSGGAWMFNRIDGAQYREALMPLLEGVDPFLYGGIETDLESMLSAVYEEQRAEWDDAQETLQMGGRGSAVAEFLGRGAIAASDQTSLALMPLGAGGGSLARIAAIEAGLGAVGEAMILPRMFEVSENLQTPAPNPVQQIAMGALFGGTLGVTPPALMRGVSYARLRQEALLPPPGVEPHVAAEAVQEAEDALRADRPVPPMPNREAVNPASEGPPPEAYEADANLVPAEMENFGLREVEEIEAEIARLQGDNPELNRRNPLIDYIRSQGGIQSRRLNPTTGDMESTVIAGELRARGITPRNFPRLFNNRTGLADIDNIVATEAFPDGPSPLRIADDELYLNRDDLLDALAREAEGAPQFRGADTRQAAEQIAAMQDRVEVVRRELDDAMQAMEGPPRGFEGDYFPTPRDEPNADPLDRAQRAEGAVERYMADTGAQMPSRAQYGAAGYLADFGGPVENAVVRAMMDEFEEEFYETGGQLAARGTEDVPLTPADVAGPQPDAPAAASRGAPDARSGGDGPRSEQTDAGEQLLAPGVDPISQRERLQLAQGAPMRGGDASMDLGMFDEGARRQQDMFDDPTTPEAQKAMDEWEAEIRETADDYGDVTVQTEDGMFSARKILDDMEADADHLAAINACTARGRGTA